MIRWTKYKKNHKLKNLRVMQASKEKRFNQCQLRGPQAIIWATAYISCQK